MVWKIPHEEVAPLTQHIVSPKYKEPYNLTPKDRKESINCWLESIGNLWQGLDNWYVSGAVNLSWQTQTFPRMPSNGDIAILVSKEKEAEEKLKELIERAKQENLFLFSRGATYKLLPSKDKHEPYHPAEYTSLYSIRKDNNLTLCRVDNSGNIEKNPSLLTRIRIYPHYLETNGANAGKLISSEEGLVLPPEYLSGPEIFETSWHNKVRGVDLRYHQQIKERMLNSFRWSRNPKHKEDLARIKEFLQAHPEYH